MSKVDEFVASITAEAEQKRAVIEKDIEERKKELDSLVEAIEKKKNEKEAELDEALAIRERNISAKEQDLLEREKQLIQREADAVNVQATIENLNKEQAALTLMNKQTEEARTKVLSELDVLKLKQQQADDLIKELSGQLPKKEQPKEG